MQEPSHFSHLKEIYPIEKAIMVANIGFNPMNNGDLIIISVPH
jgi:ribosome recycling factor